MTPENASRLVSEIYPQPGASPIADAIRARRGKVGLTSLDGVLLHLPAVAEGVNKLGGAIRNQGLLPGDIRELMILRVASICGVAFEWIHHEPIARAEGLTTAQIYVVRDISTPLPPAGGIFSSLQLSALRFADASTRLIRVPQQITQGLMRDLQEFVKAKYDEEEKAQDLFVEAAAVVSLYNMVSRFIIATDVAGLSDDEVPWPVERKEHYIPIPSELHPSIDTHSIHSVTLVTSSSAAWVVLANSLLTDLSMWSLVIPYFIQSSYNILLLSQRGHGESGLPLVDSVAYRQTTIPSLAYDIAHVIHTLQISTPIHAIIGTSQGGAAALAFSALPAFFPSTSLPSPLPTTKSIIACDTSARTPAGNKSAWEERASLAFGSKLSFDALTEQPLDDEHAAKLGMHRLTDITLTRWFPAGSPLSPFTPATHCLERASWISSLVKRTPARGFLAGAKALADYDLLVASNGTGILSPPFNTQSAPKVLLLAGTLDGDGRIGQGLKDLAEKWSQIRSNVEYVEVPEAGHLPMVDQPELWWNAVSEFLQTVS